MDIGAAEIWLQSENEAENFQNVELLDNGWVRVNEAISGQPEPTDLFLPPNEVQRIKKLE